MYFILNNNYTNIDNTLNIIYNYFNVNNLYLQNFFYKISENNFFFKKSIYVNNIILNYYNYIYYNIDNPIYYVFYNIHFIILIIFTFLY